MPGKVSGKHITPSERNLNGTPKRNASPALPTAAELERMQPHKELVLECDPRMTGSYGTLYSFVDEPSGQPSASWSHLAACADEFDILSEHRTVYSERFKQKIMQAIAQKGLAVKIIKVHLEVPKKKGYESFLEETSKIKLVRSTLGEEFEKFSYIKCVGKGGPFAFVIRCKDPRDLVFKLSIGDKAYRTCELFMILQEKGMCDLRSIYRKDPASVNIMELDRDLRLFFDIMHRSGVVHKDLKPANVVYFPNCDIKYKVIDYGLCSALSNKDASWKSKGTPGYMSPVFLMCNGHSLEKVSEQYVNKRIHKKFYRLAVETFREQFAMDPPHKSTITDDTLYELIMKKNDEFAYSIILLELQYMLENKKKVYLKNRLSRLLSYSRKYFEAEPAAFVVSSVKPSAEEKT